jgi:hypothetical protein
LVWRQTDHNTKQTLFQFLSRSITNPTEKRLLYFLQFGSRFSPHHAGCPGSLKVPDKRSIALRKSQLRCRTFAALDGLNGTPPCGSSSGTESPLLLAFSS